MMYWHLSICRQGYKGVGGHWSSTTVIWIISGGSYYSIDIVWNGRWESIFTSFLSTSCSWHFASDFYACALVLSQIPISFSSPQLARFSAWSRKQNGGCRPSKSFSWWMTNRQGRSRSSLIISKAWLLDSVGIMELTATESRFHGCKLLVHCHKGK